MRNRPGYLVAIGLVILIGLVFLGAKYGPALLQASHSSPPAGNVEPPPVDPDELPPAVEPEAPETPEEPDPGESNPPDLKPEKPESPDPSGLSNTRLSWSFTRNSQHQVPGIPEAARFIAKYGGMYVGETSRQVVHLTFDCGYENGYTAPILDALQEHQVKASFFVTESYVNKNPELVKRMVADGHAVCNHTSTHPSLPGVSNSRIEQEIRKTEEAFSRVTGTAMARYLRPPSGEYSQRTVAYTQELGYATVFWSMAFKDWDVNDQPGAEYSYNHVMANVHPGAIILLHAVSSSNAGALDRILTDLKAEGYGFAPLP